MLKSWSVLGSLLALTVACGVSCSASDGSSENGAAGASAGASAGDTGSAGASSVDCSQLSVTACATAKGCTVIKARRVSSPPTSDDEAVGCQSSQLGCNEVNIHARDPEGQEWAFSDGCIPAGWTGDGGAGN